MLRVFGLSIATTVAALIAAAVYGAFMAGGLAGGAQMMFLCFVVGVLEVSMSFDNAVVNATVLARMSEKWRHRFLTYGVPIATFGMRFLLPLMVVWIASKLPPWTALHRAFNPPPNHAAYYADGLPSYATCLHLAHPIIVGFGGMFLLPLALTWIFEKREITWLSWVERPLATAGRLDGMAVATSLIIFAGIVTTLTRLHYLTRDQLSTVLISGIVGLIMYLLVSGLDTFFDVEEYEHGVTDIAVKAVGGGLATFFYLEMLDASFSFDGVIGSFAITSDPIIIALGTGLIGSMFVRSLTVHLVETGALAKYVYLEHGAHWAIAALAIIMLVSTGFDINDVATAAVGVVIIAAAFVTSIVANRRNASFDAELRGVISNAI